MAALEILAEKMDKIARTSKTLDELTRRINDLVNSKTWQQYAWAEAAKMVRDVTKQSSKTWREAAQKTRRSSEIFKALKRELSNNAQFLTVINDNAKYITEIPRKVAEEIAQRASTRYMEGIRGEQLVKEIRAAVPGIAISKAQLIARTETAKAQAAVTTIRSRELGIDWYVWRTSEDGRVRSAHKHMAGVACQFSNPPDPEALIDEKSTLGRYGPGECPNCRCYAEPVVDPDFLTFPIKVYWGGQIQRMGKRKFLDLMR